MRMAHTGAYRGKRVRLVLRDGTTIFARFHERNDRTVFLKDEHGKTLSVLKSNIRSFSEHKPGKVREGNG